ncbi:NADPH-dependent FMN reductase [Thalassotalea crassostreae]|uniref:NADPH-dependent FMN reductase n=1 Tax=Thalassotalea crassostreae TaxID=1763536 RepID=UPI0008395D1C|nr:NAD(P)H-dependent oxidoreductase [Thalassotalea crassostreae]
MSNILAFSGSARDGSFNQQLVSIAARGAQAAGSDVTVINLKDYPMPIFCQDLEKQHGMPENAAKFKQLLTEHQGFLIASPEYNSGYTALLKNALDWASRATTPDEVPLSAFKNKFVTIMSASPGALGGMRGLMALRMLLANMQMTVTPNQLAIGQAFSAFSQGRLSDGIKHDQARDLGAELHNLLEKIHPKD